MLDAIREIGIFMIAAQAVVHFAPGRQYEKYIKSVSGIVILLLFLKPVLQLVGAVWEEPQALMEQWTKMTDPPDFLDAPQTDGVTDKVTAQMENELKERLNREIAEDKYIVSRVSIRLTSESGAETGTLQPVTTIFLRERTGEGENGRIEVEEIVIAPREPAADEVFLSYQTRFAAILGIEEERVEVKLDGSG